MSMMIGTLHATDLHGVTSLIISVGVTAMINVLARYANWSRNVGNTSTLANLVVIILLINTLSTINKLVHMTSINTWLPKKTAFEVKTPDHTPKLHGLFLFSGKRGGGKGVAMTSLLRHYKKNGCADRIFWISPTLGSNKQFLDELDVQDHDRLESCDNSALDTVMEAIEEESIAWQEYHDRLKAWKKLHSAKHVNDLDLDVLTFADHTGLLDGSSTKPMSRYGRKPILHLVIDDCMGTPLMSSGPRSKLVNMCIKHRHLGNGLGCSLWICVQSWSALGSVPRAIRENATGVALFSSPQDKQVAVMAEELCDRRGEQLFLDCYKYATEPEHGFLFVDLTDKAARYRAGWNKVLA